MIDWVGRGGLVEGADTFRTHGFRSKSECFPILRDPLSVLMRFRWRVVGKVRGVVDSH